MAKKTTLLVRIRPEKLDRMQLKLHLEDIEELKKRFPRLIPVNCVACDLPEGAHD